MVSANVRQEKPRYNGSMRAVLYVFCAVWSSLAPVYASADMPPGLLGYEWSPGTSGLTADDVDALADIAADPEARSLYRQRAVAALSALGGPRAMAALTKNLNQTTAVGRRRVVDALCAGFADQRPEEVGRLLSPLLRDADAHLRVRAASCLAAHDIDSDGRLDEYLDRVEGTWEARAAGLER